MTLGQRLHKLRKEKGYTQIDLGTMLGMSGPSYSKYEYGLRKPNHEKLLQLSTIFSVSTDYLLNGDEYFDVTFGKRVKILRDKFKFSQDQLAEKLNVSGKTVISNYETDYSEPNFETLIKMSKLFKVSTDYLLGLKEDKPNEN